MCTYEEGRAKELATRISYIFEYFYCKEMMFSKKCR